mmetsp:Transcript_38811/g.92771  ORF Transcript_38811/g.92771 Transcript_38811/m.92771 type:complete len:393 (+) Transcript_38811:3525-4703(+)
MQLLHRGLHLLQFLLVVLAHLVLGERTMHLPHQLSQSFRLLASPAPSLLIHHHLPTQVFRLIPHILAQVRHALLHGRVDRPVHAILGVCHGVADLRHCVPHICHGGADVVHFRTQLLHLCPQLRQHLHGPGQLSLLGPCHRLADSVDVGTQLLHLRLQLREHLHGPRSVERNFLFQEAPFLLRQRLLYDRGVPRPDALAQQLSSCLCISLELQDGLIQSAGKGVAPFMLHLAGGDGGSQVHTQLLQLRAQARQLAGTLAPVVQRGSRGSRGAAGHGSHVLQAIVLVALSAGLQQMRQPWPLVTVGLASLAAVAPRGLKRVGALPVVAVLIELGEVQGTHRGPFWSRHRIVPTVLALPQGVPRFEARKGGEAPELPWPGTQTFGVRMLQAASS